MKRITEVHVESFRGLREMTIKDLGDINVLIGPSNTGKTSLLEAVWLAANPRIQNTMLQAVIRGRGVAGVASVAGLF